MPRKTKNKKIKRKKIYNKKSNKRKKRSKRSKKVNKKIYLSSTGGAYEGIINPARI